ncbi:MAG: N-acetylglucosamine kinase [Bacteroidetes bacterium]|nr:MAG: N-acetylglucosamine kinase [Bacteroidota bacterium]
MIIIADGGSTKTDWRFIDKNQKISQAQSRGFNPFYQKNAEIIEILRTELLSQIPDNQTVGKLYYYGTGCSTDENQQIVKQAISEVLKLEKKNIFIEHDLLGAARALCGKEQGIACILGTGSNSCVYDGEKITQNLPNLGYILGDEGSGGHLGKQLLQDFFNEIMPERLRQFFQKRFNINRDQVVENLYKKPFSNRYLASFSKFAFDHLSDFYCANLVYQSLDLFFQRNICRYPTHKEIPVHFTGSVAFYFSNILRQVASDRGICVKNILESPIAGLTLYHLSNGK